MFCYLNPLSPMLGAEPSWEMSFMQSLTHVPAHPFPWWDGKENLE